MDEIRQDTTLVPMVGAKDAQDVYAVLFSPCREPVAWMCEIHGKRGWSSDLVTDNYGAAYQWESEQHGRSGTDYRVRMLYADTDKRLLGPWAVRDYLLRAHGMATGRMVQDDSEMRRRIGAMLEQAIQEDDWMSGFLGRGGPMADRDILK